MNLEEFDNKLGEAFKYEHLPPNEKLWQNINVRLDQQKKPLWFWLVPVAIIALVVVGVSSWLYNNDKTEVTNIAKTEVSSASIAQQKESISTENSAEKMNNEAIVENTEKEKNADNYNNAKDTRRFKSSFSALNNIEDNSEENKVLSIANTKNVKPKKGKSKNKLSPEGKAAISSKSKTKLPFLAETQTAQTTQTLQAAKATQTEDIDLTSLMFAKHRKLKTNKLQFSALLPDYLKSLTPNVLKSPNSNADKNREADFDSKCWWSAGIGPQLCLNNMKVNDSMEAYTHKQLWKNKKELTSNGSGFQTQFLAGYKLNKYFSIESGLQYSLRSESIRLNEESDDIAFRDNGKIAAYQKVILLFIFKDNNGFYDTTRYNAVQSFTMIANNKYHAVTVPLKLNSEFKVSSTTKVQLGIGLGLTYLYSKKNAHFDLMKEEKVTELKKGYFTSSFNSQLAFYTNFNNLGEIGVYTGFQGYIGRLNVVNKQYSIGMSDLQLGMCFKRPF
ncbi:MAG: hypothetical protein HQ463_02045 [Bacteroidetes bacterium]|nr:hypothetical protein [Bacteroidota bacterium]